MKILCFELLDGRADHLSRCDIDRHTLATESIRKDTHRRRGENVLCVFERVFKLHLCLFAPCDIDDNTGQAHRTAVIVKERFAARIQSEDLAVRPDKAQFRVDGSRLLQSTCQYFLHPCHVIRMDSGEIGLQSGAKLLVGQT